MAKMTTFFFLKLWLLFSISYTQISFLETPKLNLTCHMTMWHHLLPLDILSVTRKKDTTVQAQNHWMCTSFWLVKGVFRLSSTAQVGHHCPTKPPLLFDASWGKAVQVSSDWWNELSDQPQVHVVSAVTVLLSGTVFGHTNTHTHS